MSKSPAEIELDHFWRGTAHYEPFGFSDESAEEATKVFLAQNIVIPRTAPADGEVIDHGDYASAGGGPESASGAIGDNPNWLRNRAVNLLAIAEYLENREAILAAKEAEAKSARARRRDELAQEFTAVNSYSGQLPYTQNLINRIIELEGATK